MRLLLIILLLGGCAAKAPTVTLPLGSFAYTVGSLSVKVDTICRTKQISKADCEYFRKLSEAAKKALDQPQATPPIDWAELLDFAMNVAAKGAM